MTRSDDSRELGVEFGDLAEALESRSYPISNADLLSDLGDREIRLPDGSATVQELLEPMGEITYESPDDVRQAILDMVSDDAVGREHYSDRGSVTDPTTGDDTL